VGRRLTPIEEVRPEEATPSTGGERWHVTVFNNETNTYDEVITILIIATNCSPEEAWMETWEIDHLGQSVVHCGEREECESVAEVIATIGIRVEVTPEP